MNDADYRANLDRLAGDIVAGRCTAFLGAGMSYPVMPTAPELSAWLLGEVIADPNVIREVKTAAESLLAHGSYTLQEAGICYAMAYPRAGTTALKTRIRQHLLDRGLGREPPEACQILALLGIQVVVDYNYDDLFQRAAEAHGVGITLIREDADLHGLPFAPPFDRCHLFKPHGDIRRNPGDMVVTEEDYAGLAGSAGRRSQLQTRIQAWMASGSALMLGYGLADPDFRSALFIALAPGQGAGRTWYAITWGNRARADFEFEYHRWLGVIMIQRDLTPTLEDLATVVARKLLEADDEARWPRAFKLLRRACGPAARALICGLQSLEIHTRCDLADGPRVYELSRVALESVVDTAGADRRDLDKAASLLEMLGFLDRDPGAADPATAVFCYRPADGEPRRQARARLFREMLGNDLGLWRALPKMREIILGPRRVVMVEAALYAAIRDGVHPPPAADLEAGPWVELAFEWGQRVERVAERREMAQALEHVPEIWRECGPGAIGAGGGLPALIASAAWRAAALAHQCTEPERAKMMLYDLWSAIGPESRVEWPGDDNRVMTAYRTALLAEHGRINRELDQSMIEYCRCLLGQTPETDPRDGDRDRAMLVYETLCGFANQYVALRRQLDRAYQDVLGLSQGTVNWPRVAEAFRTVAAGLGE